MISAARHRDSIEAVGGSARRPVRARRVLGAAGARLPVGAAAIAGGALVVAGALSSWLSVYAGLKIYRGIDGLNGRILLAGGILSTLCGLLYLLRPAVRLRWTIGLLGACLFGFCCWILVQLFALYREIGGNPFVVGRLGAGLFICSIGAAIVLATLLLPTQDTASAAIRARPIDPYFSTLALLSGAAALIHFAVLGEHLREYWLFGLFFASAGLLQMLWALLVLSRPNGLLVWLGALGNLVIVALWLVSRTRGLPLGPEAGSAEPIGFPDVLTTVYETLLVAGCVALLQRRSLRVPRARRVAVLGQWVAALVVVPLTVAAVLAAVQATAVTTHF
jgi:hypothetical protein